MCIARMMVSEWELVKTFNLMTVGVSPKGNSVYIVSLTVQSKMIEQIRQALPEDHKVKLWVDEQGQVKTSEFELRDGILGMARRKFTTIRNFRMEIGAHHHGFRDRFIEKL